MNDSDYHRIMHNLWQRVLRNLPIPDPDDKIRWPDYLERAARLKDRIKEHANA